MLYGHLIGFCSLYVCNLVLKALLTHNCKCGKLGVGEGGAWEQGLLEQARNGFHPLYVYLMSITTHD